MALYLDIGPEDQVRVGKDAVITVVYKSGRRARLMIAGTAEVEMTKRRPDSAAAAEAAPEVPRGTGR